MGKGREAQGRCPDCGRTRTVILRYAHSSSVSQCPDCVKAQKDRRYRADLEQRSNNHVN